MRVPVRVLKGFLMGLGFRGLGLQGSLQVHYVLLFPGVGENPEHCWQRRGLRGTSPRWSGGKPWQRRLGAPRQGRYGYWCGGPSPSTPQPGTPPGVGVGSISFGTPASSLATPVEGAGDTTPTTTIGRLFRIHHFSCVMSSRPRKWDRTTKKPRKGQKSHAS